jgi:hypothetical protein
MWIVLASLLFLAKAAAAQQPDFASPTSSENGAPPNTEPFPPTLAQPQDPDDKSNSPSTKPPEEPRKGTSNDRILWTLPNFLTVEDADNIPPLTTAQKFKVTARGVFDPFEFVLVGFVAGINQASNSNSSYGQGTQGYAKRSGTAYGDNAIENFMAARCFHRL